MTSFLIVDDSRAMRMIIRRALAEGGFADADIREAADGREAVALVQAERPDLVLCDWNMPGWSGVDMLRELAAAGRWVPVILVTSESNAELHAVARQHGALAIVTKPFTPSQLADAIASSGAVGAQS